MRAILSIPFAFAFRVTLFTLGVTLLCAVVESVKRGPIGRHWPFMVAVAALLLVFFFPPLSREQSARAAVPVGCMALMAAQWLAYRKAVRGTHLAFLSLVVAGFGLANLWLALSAWWLHTHNGDFEIEVLIYRTQGALVWIIGALGVVVTVWGLFAFARWVGKRMAATAR